MADASTTNKDRHVFQTAVSQLQRSIILKTAFICFALGMVGTFSLCLSAYAFFVLHDPTLYAAGLYIFTVFIVFNMCEFCVAAYLRPRETHPAAFMLYHSHAYTIAHTLSVIEFVVGAYYVPSSWKLNPDGVWGSLFRMNFHTSSIFALLTLAFYFVRVGAMLQSGPNFSLTIETEKRADHVLIDSGLYSVLRHPAYFGWFWRTCCSQLIVANPFCFLLHTAATWFFFKERIPYEEEILLSDEFFGEKYDAYRRHTPVGIPFIS